MCHPCLPRSSRSSWAVRSPSSRRARPSTRSAFFARSAAGGPGGGSAGTPVLYALKPLAGCIQTISIRSARQGIRCLRHPACPGFGRIAVPSGPSTGRVNRRACFGCSSVRRRLERPQIAHAAADGGSSHVGDAQVKGDGNRRGDHRLTKRGAPTVDAVETPRVVQRALPPLRSARGRLQRRPAKRLRVTRRIGAPGSRPPGCLHVACKPCTRTMSRRQASSMHAMGIRVWRELLVANGA